MKSHDMALRTSPSLSCIIHCDDDTIRAAFDWHLVRYGERKRAWDTPYHISMWERAQKAFDLRSQADFDFVYEELHGAGRCSGVVTTTGRLGRRSTR